MAIAARGLARQFVLAGFRDDLAELMPGFDLLAHPAEREGLGVALLEAASCGLAIVACAAGGVVDVIEHGCTGVLVAPDDGPAFAAAVARLIVEPARARGSRRRGACRRAAPVLGSGDGGRPPRSLFRRVARAGGRASRATSGRGGATGDSPMIPTDSDLEGAALRLGRALLVRHARVATAESCTGGWIAKALTDVPGSSQWFESGVVAYSNSAKDALLGVPGELIAAHGAVSEPVVRAMAEGARAQLGVDLTVAVSGIAGPDGGSADKPVGTVWFAWATPHATTAERQVFGGDREAVRRQSVALALRRLLDLVVGR